MNWHTVSIVAALLLVPVLAYGAGMLFVLWQTREPEPVQPRHVRNHSGMEYWGPPRHVKKVEAPKVYDWSEDGT